MTGLVDVVLRIASPGRDRLRQRASQWEGSSGGGSRSADRLAAGALARAPVTGGGLIRSPCVWWMFVTFGIAAMSAIEFAVDRERREDARAAGRRSKEALDGLSSSDRREVGRAVRQGRPVNDQRLAPAAVALATEVIAGKQRSWRWVTSAVFLIWLTVPAIAAWVDRRWVLAAALSVGPMAFLTLLAVGIGLGRRARDAFEANRQLI